MTDDLEAAPDGAVEEVVQTEDEQSEAPEAAESTEGQAESQPAEDEESEEERAKSRNQRRKEAKERMRSALQEAESRRLEAERRLEQAREAAKKLPKPKQSDFADYDEYQAALSAHHAVTMMDSREAQRIEAEAKAHFAQIEEIRRAEAAEDARNWAAQTEEARTRYPDFDRVALQEAPINERMAKLIVQSDVAADIAYHLGKNPQLGHQMAGMSEVEMARAVGRLEAQLSAPKPKTASTAPEPISPVRGKASAVKDPEKMSYAEFKAARMAGTLR